MQKPPAWWHTKETDHARAPVLEMLKVKRNEKLGITKQSLASPKELSNEKPVLARGSNAVSQLIA